MPLLSLTGRRQRCRQKGTALQLTNNLSFWQAEDAKKKKKENKDQKKKKRKLVKKTALLPYFFKTLRSVGRRNKVNGENRKGEHQQQQQQTTTATNTIIENTHTHTQKRKSSLSYGFAYCIRSAVFFSSFGYSRWQFPFFFLPSWVFDIFFFFAVLLCAKR